LSYNFEVSNVLLGYFSQHEWVMVCSVQWASSKVWISKQELRSPPAGLPARGTTRWSSDTTCSFFCSLFSITNFTCRGWDYLKTWNLSCECTGWSLKTTKKSSALASITQNTKRPSTILGDSVINHTHSNKLFWFTFTHIQQREAVFQLLKHKRTHTNTGLDACKTARMIFLV
jgi:hypothetical protein